MIAAWGDNHAALPDGLVVELYDESTDNLPPLVTGTFDLATGPPIPRRDRGDTAG